MLSRLNILYRVILIMLMRFNRAILDMKRFHQEVVRVVLLYRCPKPLHHEVDIAEGNRE
jgi:hypothetical protein